MTSLKDLIAIFPRFDGTTDVEEFVQKFTANVSAHSKDDKWAVTTLCHFLDSTAQAWWARQEASYLSKLNAATAVPTQILEEILHNLTTAFPVAPFRQRAKSIARARKFIQGEASSKFLEEKLLHLHHWNPNMTESKKVKELLNSLPVSMAQSLVLSGVDSVDEFRQKLFSIMELRAAIEDVPSSCGTEEMIEVQIQQSIDRKQMETEKSSHEKTLASLKSLMSPELEYEKQKLGTQMSDLQIQHAKELEHEKQKFESEMNELRNHHDKELEDEVQWFETEINELRSRHDREMEEMELKLESEIQQSRSSLQSQREQELEASKRQTQEEFLKEMDDLKVHLHKKHDRLREETASQMKIQHEKDMAEMVLKLKQDFSASETKVAKLSFKRKHYEMARLQKEFSQGREQETRNRIKTDAWMQQQEEERKFSKGEQFHSLLQKMGLLDSLGNLETIKNDENVNRTTGTYNKNRVVPLQKTAREAWPSRAYDVVSVDNCSEEQNSDDIFSDSYESFLGKTLHGKRNKSMRRANARHFLQERKRDGRIGHDNSWRLTKSVDELTARLEEEASQLEQFQKKFLRKRRSDGVDVHDSDLFHCILPHRQRPPVLQRRRDGVSQLDDETYCSQRMPKVFHSNTVTVRSDFIGDENALPAKEHSPILRLRRSPGVSH